MKKEKLIGIYNRISEEELKKVKIKMAKRVEGMQSRQYIKFPFYPKSFYIDVVRDEQGNYTIKDREQLIPVFEYYEEYKPTQEHERR